jgi:hypothetical protein
MLKKNLQIFFRYFWPAKWTLLGLMIGMLGVASGGKMQKRAPALEFYGGFVAWLLWHLPVNPMAMTLGHVVLGVSQAALDLSREHERVHIRQYEIWGPFFVPVYLLCSLYCYLAGKDYYRDNPFEREAYRKTS